MKSDEILLRCQNIHKSFNSTEGSVNVLKGIDLSLKKGSITVISGRSGQGKSVLLSLISGVNRPTSGEIFFDDKNMMNCSRDELALIRQKKIGIIFQNFNLVSAWTALENVESALVFNHMKKEILNIRANATLTNLGLGHRLHHFPKQLSIGEQQRVAIARALIKKPELIIADEPTGDVDPETANAILTLLIEQVKRENIALLVATHGHFPLDVADQVYYLKDGKLE